MNLGYACINLTLSNKKPKVTTNRSMVKKTFLHKGLDYASELSLLNCQDLIKIPSGFPDATEALVADYVIHSLRSWGIPYLTRFN